MRPFSLFTSRCQLRATHSFSKLSKETLKSQSYTWFSSELKFIFLSPPVSLPSVSSHSYIFHFQSKITPGPPGRPWKGMKLKFFLMFQGICLKPQLWSISRSLLQRKGAPMGWLGACGFHRSRALSSAQACAPEERLAFGALGLLASVFLFLGVLVFRVRLPWPRPGWGLIIHSSAHQDIRPETLNGCFPGFPVSWFSGQLIISRSLNNSVISIPGTWIYPRGNQLPLGRIGKAPAEVGVARLRCPPRTHGAQPTPRSWEESLLNLISLLWTFVPEQAPAGRSSHYIWHPCRGRALKISSEYEEIHPLLDTDPQTSCEQPLLSLSEHATRTDQLATFQALGTVTASGMNLSHESKSWYLFSSSHGKMCSFLLRI